jgi:hypothetical protein
MGVVYKAEDITFGAQCGLALLFSRFGRNQVFSRHDLPFSIAADPRIGPDETPAQRRTRPAHPGFASLRNGSVPKRAELSPR